MGKYLFGILIAFMLMCGNASAFVSKTNFAYATLASSITDAAGGGSTFDITPGTNSGAFPTSDFIIVVYSSSCASPSVCAAREVIKLTSRSGNTFTISARNQEGTTHTGDWATSSKVTHAVTAGSLAELEITIDTDVLLAANSDALVASQKATKSYVDNKSLSVNGWVNPVTDYNASGIVSITTGTITTGTNTLTVTSATGWATGMGIAVAGAGAAAAELVCAKITVSGTTFTLLNANDSACNASTTANYASVRHDDTYAFQQAAASGQNVHVTRGCYNTSGTTTLSTPMIFEGEGRGKMEAIFVPPYTAYPPTQTNCDNASGTVIFKRSNNDVFAITSGAVSILHLGIYAWQTQDVPTSGHGWGDDTTGWGIKIGNASEQVSGGTISDFIIFGTPFGLYAGPKVLETWIKDASITYPWKTGIYINNPAPYGDVHWIDMQINGPSEGAGIEIVDADTQNFSNIKSNYGLQPLYIHTTGTQAIFNQRFTNVSFENDQPTSTYKAILDSSGGGAITGIQFNGGEIGTSPNSSAGMLIKGSGTSGVQANGIRWYANGTSCITVDDAVYTTIVGNDFEGCGTNSVALVNEANYTTIVGNTTHDSSTISISTTATPVISWGNGLQSIAKKSQYAALKYTSADTSFDWNDGNVQYFVLASGSQNVTFSNPIDGGRYMLVLKQPASGGAGTVGTWGSSNVLWPGGVTPTLTATNGKTDVITFVYDGTNAKYLGGVSLNY